MASYPLSSKAIVTYPPNGPSPNWEFKDVKVREPQEGELLVRMVATGICHTDIGMSHLPTEVTAYPRVLGHEGAGVVEKVGAGVSHVAPGDLVLLSWDACYTDCPSCKSGKPSRCGSFFPFNILGYPRFFEVDGVEAGGRYFGQSSFAGRTVVRGSSAVNVSGIVESEEELKVLAPFGCGFMTGIGSVTEVADVGEDDAVAVFGVGGVGQSAIMAAKLRGAHTIIGVDLVQSRLDIARENGATHTVNTSGFKDIRRELSEALKNITGGWGTTVNIDTTSLTRIVEAGVDSLGNGGQIILLGAGMQDELSLDLVGFLRRGISIKGSIEGDSIPEKHLPQLIQWFKEGKLPVERLIKHYQAHDFREALADMHSGATIKPVLLW